MTTSDEERAYQDSVNESEWDDPANWWAGVLYHSARDNRILVPKPRPSAGATLNLARPLGLAMALAVPVFLIALIIRAILRH